MQPTALISEEPPQFNEAHSVSREACPVPPLGRLRFTNTIRYRCLPCGWKSYAQVTKSNCQILQLETE
jgi:hypothetical protein